MAATTVPNAKINEVKNKIYITYLITAAAFTAVENKIYYNTKIGEIENKVTTDHDHDKCITIQEFNNLKSKTFTARLAQVKLASESDIANFVKEDRL